MPNKQQVRQVVRTMDRFTLEGPLEQLQVLFDKIKLDYPNQVLHVDTDLDDDYGSPKFELSVYYMRDKTEKELEVDAKVEANQKAYRRAQFEALKKEFGFPIGDYES